MAPGDGGWTVEREHRKGDAAIRGTASDLLLALWRRVDRPALDVVGDEAVADRFLGHLQPGVATMPAPRHGCR